MRRIVNDLCALPAAMRERARIKRFQFAVDLAVAALLPAVAFAWVSARVGLHPLVRPRLVDRTVNKGARPRHWPALVNGDIDKSALAAVRHSLSRGTPLGDTRWVKQTADKLNLNQTLNPRGRPRKRGVMGG